MLTPIIVVADDGPMFFRTSEDAEAYLEPIDVRNHEYVAYNASGKRLRIDIIEAQRPVFFGLGSVGVEVAKILVMDQVLLTESKRSLEQALIQFLREQDIAVPSPTTGRLRALIDACIARCGYTE